MRVERDPAFWTAVASHPEVSHILFGEEPDLSAVELEHVMPLASEHGGYIFIRLCPFGRIWDLHSLFTPEGWGREAYYHGIACLSALPDWQVITTYQTQDKRSVPPRSFGFVEAGGFEQTPYGLWKTWILTRKAWLQSPAYLRSSKTCQS